MADYYPLINRAILGLNRNIGENRRALYERARTALVAQLRSAKPALQESEITKERMALEEAIRKVESENSRRQRHADETENALAAIQEALSVRDEEIKSRKRLPPISAIPQQDESGAIAFVSSRKGPLELLPNPPSDPHDAEQNELYRRIRKQIETIRQDIPSQERSQINDVINEFLDMPATWAEVEFKKVLWLAGNALRNVLSEHDSVKNSDEPHYAKLPPGLAERLRRPVEGWNIFLLGDKELLALDSARIGPTEHRELIESIKHSAPVVRLAASNRDITTEKTGQVLTESLEAAHKPNDNIHTKQAQKLAEGTSNNLVFTIIRRAYLFCDAIIDPKTDEEKTLSKEYKIGAAKAAGALTITAAAAGASGAIAYTPQFFDFVASHATVFRDFVLANIQHAQLAQVIDVIESIRKKTDSEQGR